MIRVAPLAALLTLVVITAAGAQQWINHRPDDGGYSVAFPAKPRVDLHNVDTRVGLVRTRTSVLEVGDRTFLTIDSIYPSDFTMGDPQDDLDIVRNGGVGAHTDRSTTRREPPARVRKQDTTYAVQPDRAEAAAYGDGQG